MSASAKHAPAGDSSAGLDVSTFRKRLEAAESARRLVIERFDDARIVAALAAASSSWLDRSDRLRARTLEALAGVTGQHPDMLATGIELIFGALTKEALDALVRLEGAALANDHRRGPAVVFYALAGNVPGQSVPAVVAALLARSIAIIRDSVRQPLLTAAFCESLARVEPELAAMILPVTWSSSSPSREESELERLVVSSAARMALYGSDATLSALAARYAREPNSIVLHPTRMSAGVVDCTIDLATAAAAFAVDLAMYEGRGCLTPQVLIVEGAPAHARSFCQHLADSLTDLETKWPRARGSLAEESARRAAVDRAEVAALRQDPGEAAWIGRVAAWCIRLGGDEPIALGPGLRCVRVVGARDRAATIEALARSTTPLAAVGVASADGREIAALDRALAPLGVTLVAPAGRMQAPPLSWQQDGRRLLADLLEAPP